MQTCGNSTYLYAETSGTYQTTTCKLFIEPLLIYQLRTIDGPSISNNSLYTTINHLSKSYYNPHWCTNIQNCNNSHRGEYTKQQYTFFLLISIMSWQRETTLKVEDNKEKKRTKTKKLTGRRRFSFLVVSAVRRPTSMMFIIEEFSSFFFIAGKS